MNPALRAARRIIGGLTLTSLALASGIVYLLLHPKSPKLDADRLLAHPELREQAVARLVEASSHLYDAHVDGDVGRVLQPKLDQRPGSATLVSSNRLGLRERAFALPKPEGTVRVVLLGDSFVHGSGVLPEERLGAHLQLLLTQHARGFSGLLECVHVGIPSWNIRAEVAYARRMLSDLDPDLVIQLAVPNDVADSAGVRGFGNPGRFSTQLRHRADSIVDAAFPIRVHGTAQPGYLRWGIDYEGLSRYQQAVEDLRHLAGLLARRGAEYRLVLHYRQLLAIARQHIGRHLPAETAIYLASDFGLDPAYWVSPSNSHWNGEGHHRVALVLYHLIVRDRLLPEIDLKPLPAAEAAFAAIAEAGRREAGGQPEMPRWRIAASLELARLDDSAAAQIHGGVDPEGRISPYASMILKNDGQRLRVIGRGLPRPELDGGRVGVFVDADRVGELELQAGRPIDVSFPLPASAARKPYLSVRFESADYVYVGDALQHCVVFELRRVEIE
ncbi:MAG: SGNH/GDSL hydrolase family protein [Acidobacteriota bacterium]